LSGDLFVITAQNTLFNWLILRLFYLSLGCNLFIIGSSVRCYTLFNCFIFFIFILFFFLFLAKKSIKLFRNFLLLLPHYIRHFIWSDICRFQSSHHSSLCLSHVNYINIGLPIIQKLENIF
jgi:hypothetical protein